MSALFGLLFAFLWLAISAKGVAIFCGSTCTAWWAEPLVFGGMLLAFAWGWVVGRIP